MQMPRGCLSPNSTDGPSDWTGRPAPMNWIKIARCTAVAVGTTFAVAAGAYLVIHIFLFDL
jgi:hypothetical protein